MIKEAKGETVWIDKWMLSPVKNKKYRVILSDGRKIDFGDTRHFHYRDNTPLKAFSHLNHLDKTRRENYYKRHKKDYPKYSADYMSKTYLW